MDPYDILEAADVATQIPPSFFNQIESKKWSDRKEALDIIEKATAVPKIQNSDFNELIRILKRTIAKDSNVVVVTLAAKCLSQLAQGLRQNFAPHADSTMPILFEKFKEKKPNVNSVMRDAADAVFVATNIENIHEDVIKFLDNKNPQIKTEMALFISRSFSRFPAQVLNKKTLRPIINALIKTLSDMDSTVRDNSALAIGTAMKVTGEKLMMTLIADVEPMKISKIKEFSEKVEIMTAPVNGIAISNDLPNGDQNVQEQKTNGATEEAEEEDEDCLYDMLDPVDITSQIPPSFFNQIESKKWSDRKEALDIIEKATAVPKIQNSDFNELIRILKRTIAKDSNVVVVTLAAKCLSQLAQGLRQNFAPHADSTMPILFEKYKEKKPNVNSVMRDAADAVFVSTNMENILEDVIKFLDNKNPQIKSEMALFIARSFSRFPAQVLNKKTLRPIINALIKTLSDMDSTVRDNSALAIGTAMKVTGEKLMMTLIADVEPIKIPKIKEFCEKAQVKKIPKAALKAMNTATQPAPPPPQANPPKSSATMIRSSSSKKLPTKSGIKPAAPAPANATVKRTATIIKRSTVPKRASMPPPASLNHAAPPQMGPPLVTNNTINHQQQQLLQPQQQQQPPALVSTPAKPVYATTHVPQRLNNHDDFDLVIWRLISDSPDEVMDSLNELDESLSDESESRYKSRINQLIDLICLQLIKSFSSLKTNPSDDSQSLKIKKISDLLTKLFNRRQLVSEANQQTIRFLLVQIFTMTQNCNDGVTMKTLNNLALAIMDGFEPANTMCILTGILNEPAPTSIVEPVKNAIIRSMRSFK